MRLDSLDRMVRISYAKEKNRKNGMKIGKGCVHMDREKAITDLRKYNSELFHLQHAFTVEGVMRWYAQELGFGDEADFWATVGLLHGADGSRGRFCPDRQPRLRLPTPKQPLRLAAVPGGEDLIFLVT